MTIRMFAVDGNNDLYIGSDGRLAIVEGREAVLQGCAHAMLAQLREMVLAYDKGLPNFDVVWNGNPNLAQFEAAARLALTSVPGVIQVTEFSAVNSGTVLRYTAVIRSIYGEFSLNG